VDSSREPELVEALREGDESAFTALVDRYHASLVRVARIYVRDNATAEEVAQETWVAVLGGIDTFEARSSVKTWLFRILANRAKTRGQREARSIPFSAMGDAEQPAAEPHEPAELGPGLWHSWEGDPEERLLAGEARQLILATIETLPPSQRATITLRDIEGMSAEEVCNVLDVSDTNQRVLLHRARSTVRRALERYLGETERQ
jgi:RNA polymerase sigma-70 factor (ECF subfamily)